MSSGIECSVPWFPGASLTLTGCMVLSLEFFKPGSCYDSFRALIRIFKYTPISVASSLRKFWVFWAQNMFLWGQNVLPVDAGNTRFSEHQSSQKRLPERPHKMAHAHTVFWSKRCLQRKRCLPLVVLVSSSLRMSLASLKILIWPPNEAVRVTHERRHLDLSLH